MGELCLSFAYRNQDPGDVLVEPVAVIVPILDHQTPRRRLQGPGNVRVYPEGPQRVVEVEDEEAGQGEPVVEGRGLGDRLRGCCGCG